MHELTIEEAVVALKLDPTRPVRAKVDGLTVELQAVAAGPADHSAPQPPAPASGEPSAADLLRGIGPWEGETLDELLRFFSRARRQGGSGNVPEL